jgi:hypothetical protein
VCLPFVSTCHCNRHVVGRLQCLCHGCGDPFTAICFADVERPGRDGCRGCYLATVSRISVTTILKTLNTRLFVRTRKDNEDERPYYVALVKTPHRKLQKTEQFSGETYIKGTFVVEITWCQLDSRTASGTRHYIKLDWHQTLCANQVSRAGTKILAKR